MFGDNAGVANGVGTNGSYADLVSGVSPYSKPSAAVLASLNPGTGPILYNPAAFAAPQETRGSVNGIVSDSSGGVVPGTTLQLTNIDTGVVLTATSNEAGFCSHGLTLAAKSRWRILLAQPMRCSRCVAFRV